MIRRRDIGLVVGPLVGNGDVGELCLLAGVRGLVLLWWSIVTIAVAVVVGHAGKRFAATYRRTSVVAGEGVHVSRQSTAICDVIGLPVLGGVRAEATSPGVNSPGQLRSAPWGAVVRHRRHWRQCHYMKVLQASNALTAVQGGTVAAMGDLLSAMLVVGWSAVGIGWPDAAPVRERLLNFAHIMHA